MKKRFLSILLSLCMVLALLPVTAFAEDNEEPTETPVCTCEAACMAEAMNPDCPVCGAEGATIENCGKYEAPVEETEPEQTALEKVQALIDALPDADTITEENRADVEAQLTAIDEAKFPLSDELDALDFTKYNAAIAVLNEMDGMGGAEVPETLADTTLPDWVDNSNQNYYKIQSNVSSITLTGDVNLPDKNLSIDHDVTLDLNGHTLTMNEVLKINSGCTLTLLGTNGGELILAKDSSGIEVVSVSGTLKAHGGTIKNTTVNNSVNVYSNGSIECDNDKTPTNFSIRIELDGGTINGGNFQKAVSLGRKSSSINGGTFNEYVSDAGTDANITLHINGGTFNSRVYATWNTCKISGGTFNERIEVVTKDAITISGGDFYSSISDKCTFADGSHKITFMNGSSTYATQVVASGKTTSAPRTPTASANQCFTGWYTNESCTDKFSFGSTLTKDITLYAGFESSIASATVTANTLTYTGEAQTLVSTSNMKHGTVMYSLDASADLSAYTSTIPTGKDATDYTVYYYVKATDSNYTDSAKQMVSVIIVPKEVSVSGITAEDKTYDGDTPATLNYDTVTFGGKVDGDTLTVTATGAFADRDVGESKNVSISNLTLGGLDAGNYVLAPTGQQTETTADITAKEVTVSGITAQDKTYDGDTLATLNYDAATFGGKVDGDMLTVSATGAFADKNVGENKNVTISNLTLGGADAGNYTLAPTGQQTETTADITKKSVTVSDITAQDKTYDGNTAATLNYDTVTINGKVDGDTLTVTATGTFSDQNVGEDKTVSISNLTLDGEDAGNYKLAPTGQQTETTADITKKAVTLKSATASKAYDGTALTNETVTASGMAAGEEFAYDFTGTQTDIGSSRNTFTAKDSATAKMANYEITYDYGTLTVSLPANVGDAVKGMTVDTVTSDDRKSIEDTKKAVEDYLSMDLTDDEKTTLNELKTKTEGLFDRLDEVKAAMEDEVITGTDGITKDNVKIADKKALTDTKAAIEKLLKDYSGNLTAKEKQTLNGKLERIGKALDEIARLEKAANNTTNKSPQTGDNSHMALWLALILLSGGALAGTAVYGKKRKHSAK